MVDSIGVETKAPIKDWVEVGIFGPAHKGEERGKPLYLKKHLINSPNQTVTILVPGRPAKAGIDPNYLLVDWELKDNTQDVKM
ncbi:hypothetical protein JAO76_01465 [Pontibacter sp. BT310]|uniref:Uncharacterized protein n=1 Tax=Pontibacter populi TaxID=890055 RepID=A0ABS6X863_9BACT|nr:MULTISPECIES: hypothetical protein [Pontibacter]MBJ6116840.1 hypothetical protein [Pontibacter sp. BT310]MBR0569262.1 hypothetical protein [Microvirga sp. STS03]MBW3363693.1 hypothetical protein [Pontibacter populi]